MDGTRPILIQGDDLCDHIKSQRAKRAVKTRIDTLYCVCCRRERRAAEDLADCNVIGGRVKLTALCQACGTVLSKPVREAKIPETARILDLKTTRQ